MPRSRRSCSERPLRRSNAFNKSTGHRRPLFRQRYGDTGCFTDGFGLTQYNFKNSPVDRAVWRVEEHRSDNLGLSKAIDPSFALLMPCRIPRKIVMHDAIEKMLEVDAFGQAIGRNKNALRSASHRLHSCTAVFRRQHSCDGFHAQLWETPYEGQLRHAPPSR